MAKKRKVGKQPSRKREVDSAANGSSSRLNINTFEDVADSEDEFQIHRDKILLEEGPAQKRQRKIQEEEQLLEPSDEEVLPVDDEPWSSAEEDDFEGAEDGEDDGEDEGLAPRETALTSKNMKKPLKDSEDEDVDDSRQDEGEQGWGSSKKDYYDADVIETEADALEEEAEARRLQQSQLQDMTAADFGFDEAQWQEADKEEAAGKVEARVRREKLPKIEVLDSTNVYERIGIMQANFPEFEPLGREFLAMQSQFDELMDTAMKMYWGKPFDSSDDGERDELKSYLENIDTILSLKYRSANAYMGALCMYFALMASGPKLPDGRRTVMPPEDMREHPIMERLLLCRELWTRIKKKPLPYLPPGELVKDNARDYARDLAGSYSSIRFKDDAISAPLALEVNSTNPPSTNPNDQLSETQRKRIDRAERKRIVRAEHKAVAAREKASAQQKERLRQAELSIEDLPDLTKKAAKVTTSSTRKPNQTTHEDDNSDIGEPTSLTAHELAEKAKRKKSLKFYTSQIAQKSNKRDGAGRDAGGDTDLPYRERLRDRQERLKAESERRGEKSTKLSTAGASLGQGSSDEEDAEQTNSQRRQKEDAADSDNEYYDQIVKRSSDKMASKAANAKAYETALKSGSLNGGDLDGYDNLDAKGKRAIGYAIEKNKGLHQHRKKDVRNPRVKKRKKFEEKQKKLKTIRPVYRTEREGQGGYGGEKTGIKKNLVKSVKL